LGNRRLKTLLQYFTAGNFLVPFPFHSTLLDEAISSAKKTELSPLALNNETGTNLQRNNVVITCAGHFPQLFHGVFFVLNRTATLATPQQASQAQISLISFM
jgi:hypothetical protein